MVECFKTGMFPPSLNKPEMNCRACVLKGMKCGTSGSVVWVL